MSLMQADYLGQMRTGAASGVATRYMARPDASEVGLFGTGTQARTQILAVCKVRKIRQVIEGLSLDIATPAEAREMLSLKGAKDTNF